MLESQKDQLSTEWSEDMAGLTKEATISLTH